MDAKIFPMYWNLIGNWLISLWTVRILWVLIGYKILNVEAIITRYWSDCYTRIFQIFVRGFLSTDVLWVINRLVISTPHLAINNQFRLHLDSSGEDSKEVGFEPETHWLAPYRLKLEFLWMALVRLTWWLVCLIYLGLMYHSSHRAYNIVSYLGGINEFSQTNPKKSGTRDVKCVQSVPTNTGQKLESPVFRKQLLNNPRPFENRSQFVTYLLSNDNFKLVLYLGSKNWEFRVKWTPVWDIPDRRVSIINPMEILKNFVFRVPSAWRIWQLLTTQSGLVIQRADTKHSNRLDYQSKRIHFLIKNI